MRWFITRNGIHTVLAVGSLVAIGHGLHAIYPPLCPTVVGSLLLTAVVYARTRTGESR